MKYEEILKDYEIIKEQIKQRINEFKNHPRDELSLFKELCFCLLTPQSKAIVCDKAINNLFKKDIFKINSLDEIKSYLNGVRFKNNKAKYILEAKKKIKLLKGIINYDEFRARELLVKNFKGIGYKEASHFLRNIGKVNIAILDRHILKNLFEIGVIKQIPKTLSKNKYLEIEKEFFDFSNKIKIPISHLDLLFWYRKTGFIFK